MNRDTIERMLPEVFQRTAVDGSPTAALLDAMCDLLTPIEQTLENVDEVFSPHRAPERFIPMLARWVDLGPLLDDEGPAPHPDASTPGSTPSSHLQLRDLVVRAARLARMRGTRAGLLSFLETATGHRGFAIDEQVRDDAGVPLPFHIRIGVPTAARDQLPLIRRIVALEKPAYVTCTLDLDDGGEPTPP